MTEFEIGEIEFAYCSGQISKEEYSKLMNDISIHRWAEIGILKHEPSDYAYPSSKP